MPRALSVPGAHDVLFRQEAGNIRSRWISESGLCTHAPAGDRRRRGRNSCMHAVFLSGLGQSRTQQQVSRHAPQHRNRGDGSYRNAGDGRRAQSRGRADPAAGRGRKGRRRRRHHGRRQRQARHRRHAAAPRSLHRRRRLSRQLGRAVPFDMSHIYASGNIAADMYCNVAARRPGACSPAVSTMRRRMPACATCGPSTSPATRCTSSSGWR